MGTTDAGFRPQGVAHDHQHHESERALVLHARAGQLTLLDAAWAHHDALERQLLYQWATVGDAETLAPCPDLTSVEAAWWSDH